MTNIIGVDVGKFGALVSLSDINNYLLMPMGGDSREGVALEDVFNWMYILDFPDDVPLTVCIEQQWTFGREGRRSIANLMLQYGQLWGFFHGFEPRIIPVPLWKKHHGIKGGTQGKKQAVDLVTSLYPGMDWPKLKQHRHGVADAILIALYGRDVE